MDHQRRDDDGNEMEQGYCIGCSGSGEGMFEGSKCSTCGGSGAQWYPVPKQPGEPQDEDEDEFEGAPILEKHS